jgi:1,2-diacylglycerol 3-alpha-glucosyltransferase
MKIIHFSDNFYPEMSGISDSIIATSKELAKLGHEVMICAPKYCKKNYEITHLLPEELDLGEKVKIKRFFSFPYPGPTKQSRFVIPSFSRWPDLGKFKPDILHAHLFFGTGLEGLIASKMLNKPLIGTSHTPIIEFLKTTKFNFKPIPRLMSSYVSWFYNHCKFVSGPSQCILNEMKDHGFKTPCKVISNPVLLDVFNDKNSGDKAALKKKFNLSENAIVYTGRLAPEKHVDVILRAVAIVKEKIPNINFSITGHGSALDDLKKLAFDLKISDNVKFLGYIKTKEMAELYTASDMLAIASTAETQCMSMMWGFASGLPAIGVDAWALPEYINDDNGFVVPPNDHVAFAEKISYLLNNPEKRKQLGDNAVRYAQQFSAPAIAKEWESVYTRVK